MRSAVDGRVIKQDVGRRADQSISAAKQHNAEPRMIQRPGESLAGLHDSRTLDRRGRDGPSGRMGGWA